MRSADFFATHPVFTREQFAAATGRGLDRSARTPETLLSRAVAAGRLLHVRRGLYAAVPPGASATAFQVDPYLVATQLGPDATVAYHAALQYRGQAYSLWQRFQVLLRGQLRELRFQGLEYVRAPHPAPFRHRSDLGGGIVTERHGGGEVRVTTVERTFVDVLDVPELGGGWEEILRSLDLVEYFELDAVVAYALALGSQLTCARVGWYLDMHRERLFVQEPHLAALRERAPPRPRYLDATRAPGHLVKPWNIVVPENILTHAWEEDLGDALA